MVSAMFGFRESRCSVAAALAVLSLVLAAGVSGQQTGQIVGQVVARESGAPLSEVQIYVVGTGLGTLSRPTGQFLILNVPAGTHQVRAERIGMGMVQQTVTVTAGAAVQLRIEMANQALGLDEIVVTGTAGASRRREIGNSINQIDVANRLDLVETTSDLLKASAPGVTVTLGDGMIGQGSQVVLRGNASIGTRNTPIIYIDGVRMMSTAFEDTHGLRSAHVTVSPLDNINPSDIERIEVIKGSAATTLYGTEAAAGVIQVFTKKGSVGTPTWTVELRGGTGWARKWGVDPEPYFYMDDYLRRAYNQDYSGSVRGGAQSLQYFASAQTTDATGIMPLDEERKYVVRGNFTFVPLENLQVQWNSSLSRQHLQGTPTGRNSHGITQNAIRQSGNYFANGNPNIVIQNLNWDIFQDIDRMTMGGTTTWSPLTNLTNRFTMGYDYNVQEARDVRPYGFYFLLAGNVFDRVWQKRILTVDEVATYSFNLTENVRSNLSLGGQAIGDDVRWISGEGEGIPGTGMEATVSSAATRLASEGREKVWNVGFFVQNVFDINNKYFFTAGVRVDGNSNFGENFGLQMYPKLSTAWIMSDEAFWPERLGTMKARVAYGQSGRAPGAFDKLQTWTATSYLSQPAFTPGNLGSGDLGPEITAEIEAGFDASWFNDRVSSSFTYYRQTTTDALYNVGQLPSAGFGGSQLTNIGEILNQGTELSFDISAIQTTTWAWDLNLSFATNSSKVVDLGGLAPFSALQGWIEEGQPVPVVRGRFMTNPDEIANPKFETEHFYGPQIPTRTATVGTGLRLPGGVGLSASGEYRGGHYRNEARVDVARSGVANYCNPYYVKTYKRYDNTWIPQLKPDTPALWRGRCSPTLFHNDYYWFQADFFRLRTVTVQIPLEFALPSRVTNAQLTVSFNNGFLWTKLPWGDPEMLPQAGGANAVGSGADQDEKVPAGHSLQAALRVTF